MSNAWERMKNRHSYELQMHPEISPENPKPEPLTSNRRSSSYAGGIRERVEIFKDEVFCFAHIPTLGGSIMKDIARTTGKVNYHHHAIAPMDGKRLCTKHKKRRTSFRPFFSIVGNPFEWLIRLWFYNWPYGEHATRDQIKLQPQHQYGDLETFLYEFNSIRHWIPEEWNKNHDDYEHPLFSYRHLQVCQTFDKLNNFGSAQFENEFHKFSRAKFYGRIEMIDEVLGAMNIGKKYGKEEKAYGDYRRYYNNKLIDHISKHRKQELDLLGYDFNGPTDDLAVFKINAPFVWEA